LAIAGVLFYRTIKSSVAKKVAVGIATVCFLLGAVNTSWQVFFFRQGFSDEFPTAGEEREVGRYLAEHLAPEKILSFNWFYFETIRYYSGGRRISLLDDNSDVGAAGFFLLVPTELINFLEFSPEFSERISLVYQKERLTLFEIAEVKKD